MCYFARFLKHKMEGDKLPLWFGTSLKMLCLGNLKVIRIEMDFLNIME